MSEKSYIPWTMWGSWAGGIILVLFSLFSYPTIKISHQLIGISLILGFLFGWGIHSFVRVLRE